LFRWPSAFFFSGEKTAGKRTGKAIKLPNPHLIRVESDKITEYLLNSTHPYGASKAQFFTRFGFERQKWEDLAAALLEHGRDNEVTPSPANWLRPAV
jgi:hypothetical protein